MTTFKGLVVEIVLQVCVLEYEYVREYEYDLEREPQNQPFVVWAIQKDKTFTFTGSIVFFLYVTTWCYKKLKNGILRTVNMFV